MNKYSPFYREPYSNSNDLLEGKAFENHGASIPFGTLVCENVKLSSRDGASGIVYTGDLFDNEDIDPEPIPVIIKESYPLSLAPHITRSPDGCLHVKDDRRDDYLNHLSSARNSFRLQHTLFRNPSLRDIIATPRGSRSMYGTAYFISYADQGKTLETFASERKGQLKLADCFELTAAIADAIALFHDEGYLYLDLKPSNILIQELDRTSPNEPSSYRIKFFDFDSVVRRERIGETELNISNSAEWSSYEQRHPELWNQVSEKSDVYALGAILFWLLTGEKPSLPAIGHASACDGWELNIGDFPEPIMRKLTSSVIDNINNLLSCSLNNNASQRFESCNEFAIKARGLSLGKSIPEEVGKHKHDRHHLEKGILCNLEYFVKRWSMAAEQNRPNKVLREIEEQCRHYLELLDGYQDGIEWVADSREQLRDTDGPFAEFEPSIQVIDALDNTTQELCSVLALPLSDWDEEHARDAWRLYNNSRYYVMKLGDAYFEFDTLSIHPELKAEAELISKASDYQ